MIDRIELARQHKTAVLKCALLALLPVLLVSVAWFMFSSPDDSGPALGSGDIATMHLLLLGVSALVPLPATYFMRRSASRAYDQRDPGMSIEVGFAVNAVAESGLWAITSLMGFVAFFQGATWALFLGLQVLSYVGRAYSFPRWADWTERADELDVRTMTGGDPAPVSV